MSVKKVLVGTMFGAAAAAAAYAFGGGYVFRRIGLARRPFPWDAGPGNVSRPWDAPPTPRMTYADGKKVPFDPDGKGKELAEADTALYKMVTARGVKCAIRSYDGLHLAARYLPPEEGVPRAIVLMMHGFRANPMKDFSAAACDLTAKGYGLLLVDQRTHNDSEGDLITYGVRERYDARDWAQMLERKFPGVPVFAYGVSMGAATVMAAAPLFPTNVRGIIADCGYTNMRAIFAEVIARDYHLPPFPVLNAAEIINRAASGFGFRDVDSAQELRKGRIPVLLIHGDADSFVPFRMGKEIDEKIRGAVDVTFCPIPGADHAMSYVTAREKYAAEIQAFMGKCTAPPAEV